MYLPIVYGISFGFEERYGELDEDGNFSEITNPRGGYATAEFLPLAGDILLEVPCAAEILDALGNPMGEIEVGVVDGRVALVAVRAYEGHELTGQVFRSIPVAQLVPQAARSKIAYRRDGFAVRFINDPGLPTTTRRQTINDEFLAAVAAEYRSALSIGIPPSLAVQQRFGPTSHENARRWVAIARREGFLGKSLGARRKGEAQNVSS